MSSVLSAALALLLQASLRVPTKRERERLHKCGVAFDAIELLAWSVAAMQQLRIGQEADGLGLHSGIGFHSPEAPAA